MAAKRWILLVLCLLVAGCSLPALPLPTGGAASDEQLGGGILRIAVPDGTLPDCASPDQCILVRAAEATRRAGGTHFTVLPGHGGSTQKGYAYIRAFTFAAGEDAPSSAMSVEEALHFYRRPQARAAS